MNKDVQIVIGSNIQGAINGLDKVSKATFRMGRDMERMGSRLGSVFDPALKALVAGFTAAAAAATALSMAAFNVGGSFEEQMMLVKNVASATTEEFDLMTEKARSLGRDLPITATEAASAMYELASAGLSAKEMLEAIDSVVAISVGQNYDLAESAALVVSTLRGFGLEADQAGRVVDVFTNAANVSQLTLEKLSNSMTYVAPLAKALGISLEETAAAMGVLSDTGMEGSQIGTSLRRVLSSLANPTGEAAKGIKDLGVQIYDTVGKMRPLADIMRDFGTAGLTAEQALEIFGDRGAVAALQLAAMTDRMKEYQASLSKAGTAQEQLNELMQAWNNVWKATKSAGADVLITVFEQMKSKAAEVANAFREMLNVLNEWASGTGVISKSIEAFFSGLTGGLPTIEGFKAALEKINVDSVIERFRKMGETVRALVEQIKGLIDAVPWAAIFRNFETIGKVVLGGWVVGKGLYLGGGILLLISSFTRFASSVANVGKAIAAADTVSKLGAISGASKGLLAALTGPVGLVAAIIALGGALGYTAAKHNAYLKEIQDNNRGLAEEIVKTDEFIQEIMAVGKGGENEIEAPKLTGIDLLIKDAEETGLAIRRVWSDTATRVEMTVEKFGAQLAGILKAKGEGGAEELKTAFASLPDDLGGIMSAAVDQVNKNLENVGKGTESQDPLMRDLPEALAKFTIQIEGFKDQARQAMKLFGISAEDATEVFKDSVLASAESTADDLVEKFDNPQLRNVFIHALDRMGHEGGQALLTQVANAMKQVEEQALTLDEKIKAITEQAQSSMPQGEWETTIIREDENAAVVQVTDGIRYMFETIEKASAKTEDAMSWTQAIDFTGMATRAQTSLDTLGGYSKQLGSNVGGNLYTGIMDGVMKAVDEAKKQLSTLSVNVKVNSTTNTGTQLLTDSMRGDL